MSDEREVIRADLNAIQAHAVSATEQLNHLPPNVGYVTVNAEGVPEIADKLRALESQNQALQEALQGVLWHIAWARGEEPFETAFQLLSPTQETDPE